MAHLSECHELVEMVRCIMNSMTYSHLPTQLKESMDEGDEEDEDEYEETATDNNAR